MIIKIRDAVDTLFSHNEIIALWYDVPNTHCSKLLWKGMGHKIPENYLDYTIKRFFGTVPNSITEADILNILVKDYEDIV